MLEVTGLTVRYDTGDAYALRNVGFSIADGERVALAGANGAGKSTLLKRLAGVIVAESGEVMLDGVRMEHQMPKKSLAEIRRKIGLLFQNPDDQLFMPTVYEDVAFGPRNYHVDEREIEERAEEVLRELGIIHLKERMTHKLSGGEKRLAALAGILIMSPSVILMDEPTSFLDPRARRRLIEVLSGLSQTMLIATHDMDLALSLCRRAILLKEGRVHADADVNMLRDAEMLEECGL